MCGIIGALSLRKTGLGFSDITTVKELLVANTVRGYDASGLFWHKPNKESTIWYRKDAVTGAELYKTRAEWSELNDSRFVVGHNRAATIGGTSAEVAHPFITSHVVGVHNGTVRSWEWDLKDHKTDARLDSEAIMMALSAADPELESAAGVLAKLELGAYAVVWWDARVKALRFARNGDRPLFMCTTPSTLWWASELRMLEWVLDRNDYAIKESWDLQRHTILSLPIESGGEATYLEYADKLPKHRHSASTERWIDRSYYRGGWALGGPGGSLYEDDDDNTLYPNSWQEWSANKRAEVTPPQQSVAAQTKAGYVDFSYRSTIPSALVDVDVATQIYTEARELAGLTMWNMEHSDMTTLREAIGTHILMGNPEAIFDRELQATLVPVHVVDLKGDTLYGYVDVDDERIAVSFGMCDKALIDAVSHILITDREAVVHNVELGGIRAYHHGDLAYRVCKIHGLPHEVWVGDVMNPKAVESEEPINAFGTYHPDRLYEMANVDWTEGWKNVKEH